MNQGFLTLVMIFHMVSGACLFNIVLSPFSRDRIHWDKSELFGLFPISLSSSIIAYVSINLNFLYAGYCVVGTSFHDSTSKSTVQWSDRNRPFILFAKLTVSVISVKMRSSILPDLCVGVHTSCCRPIASIVLMNVLASVSRSSFTCRLKSPARMILLYFGSMFDSHSVMLSRNIALVTGCWFE